MTDNCLSCSHAVPEGRVLFCTLKRGCVRPVAVCSRYENFKNEMAKKLERTKGVFPLEKTPHFNPGQTSENLHTYTGGCYRGCTLPGGSE